MRQDRNLETKEAFQEFSREFQNAHQMPYAFALGEPFADGGQQPTLESTLAVRWRSVNIEKNMGFMSAVMDFMNIDLDNKDTQTILIAPRLIDEILWRYLSPFKSERGHTNAEVLRYHYGNDTPIMLTIYSKRETLTEHPPVDRFDAMCRLAMISRRLFKPNELNLDDMFGKLPLLVFTAEGAMKPESYNQQFETGSFVQPVNADKIPPMWWGAPIPSDVRIADLTRVRLGAYLAPGTVVMHEGFINHNAGTLGTCMVEGRISAGVIVGANSDIGGGASIMGTLSGGGKEKITIGENCLLGANAGTGISLGDRCTIEAGLYVTVGTKVFVNPEYILGINLSNNERCIANTNAIKFNESFCKAEQLSGLDDMLFIRNSVTGAIELRWNKKPNKLNTTLHQTVTPGKGH